MEDCEVSCGSVEIWWGKEELVELGGVGIGSRSARADPMRIVARNSLP